jgi:hypothetical protein
VEVQAHYGVPKLIIVEGPDGAGKSRLAAHLSKELSIPLSAHSRLTDVQRNDPGYRSPDQVRERTYLGLIKAVKGDEPAEIHDRFLYSELVYSEVYGRRPCFGFYESRHISRVLMALECPVIFCLPPLEIIQARMLPDEHMEGAYQRIAQIHATYSMLRRFMSRRQPTHRGQVLPGTRKVEYSTPRVILYDYTNLRHKDKVTEICGRYLARRDRRMPNAGLED